MKNSHAPRMLLATLLAAGWAAAKPALSGGVAQDAPKNGERRESARESGPALVVVTVDAERSVFLGKEQVGTCDDVGPLKEGVKRAIEKKKRAARDRGDEEEARSAGAVLICASPDLKYRDVVKVVDAIREAGGDPVGLDTDCPPPK